MSRAVCHHFHRHAGPHRPGRLTPAALLLGLAAAAAGPSQAAPIGVYNQYFVTGGAFTGTGSGSDNRYSCNMGGVAGALTGCVGNPGLGLAYLANTTTGTVDATGRTTAFFADTTRRSFHLEYPDNVPTVVVDPAFSRARAAADLASASLRASVVNDSNNTDYVFGQAVADLHDIVTLNVAGADASTRTRVNFSFAVDGQVDDTGKTTIYGQPGAGSMEARLLLNDLSSANDNGPYTVVASAGWSKTSYASFVQNAPFYENRGDAALSGGSWVQNSRNLMQFDGWLDIVGASATINPTLFLSVNCDIGLVCDYGSTAKFSFVGLPASVSYSSDSGVFLTAVPEPQSWAMLLAGMVALGLVARRRA